MAVRALCRAQAQCLGVNAKARTADCSGDVEGRAQRFTLAYDALVVAVGAQARTFGVPGVAQYAHFLRGAFHRQTP